MSRLRGVLAFVLLAISLGLPTVGWPGNLPVGRWTALETPGIRTDCSAIVDSMSNRLVVFGGRLGQPEYTDEVWVHSLDGSTGWIQLFPDGPGPTPRAFHSAIPDPVGRRMVVFGGQDGQGRVNDVWSLSLDGSPVWSRLTIDGAEPSPRARHSAILDDDGRMIVFGGVADSAVSEVWSLSFDGVPTWTNVTPGGSQPTPRSDHVAVYDSSVDRMIIFGGSPFSNDTWALSLGEVLEWSQLGPSGTLPPVRRGHVAVFDPAGHRMVVCGGQTTGGALLNDTWVLELQPTPAWSPLGVGGTLPASRRDGAGAFDAAGRRLILFGGQSTSSYQNDSQSLGLGETPGWSQLPPTAGPGTRSFHVAIHDPVRDRMIIYGGSNAGSSAPFSVWALSLRGAPQWTQLPTIGTPPQSLVGVSAIYDPVRDRMLIFGGGIGTSEETDALYSLSLGDGPTWSLLETLPDPVDGKPARRSHHGAIYDPVRDRMVVVGGHASGPERSLGDAWALSLGSELRWRELVPDSTVAGVDAIPSLFYDSLRDRALVLGWYRDELALSLDEPAWSVVPIMSEPGPDLSAAYGFYDPRRDALVFCGLEVPDGQGPDDPVRSLPLAGPLNWMIEEFDGSVPPDILVGHSVLYDPGLDRMIMFGGYPVGQGGTSRRQKQVWSLNWGSVDQTPVELSSLTAEWLSGTIHIRWLVEAAADHAGFHVYREMADGTRMRLTPRLLTRGPEFEFVDRNPVDTARYWLTDVDRQGDLTWHGPILPGPRPALAALSLPARPNPFHRMVTVMFDVPVAGHYKIDVFDLQRRKVRLLEQGTMDLGRHEVRWDARDDESRSVPSGIYFVRVGGPSGVQSFKVVRQ